MNSFQSYLGVVAVLFISIFVADFFDSQVVLPASIANTHATSPLFFETSGFFFHTSSEGITTIPFSEATPITAETSVLQGAAPSTLKKKVTAPAPVSAVLASSKSAPVSVAVPVPVSAAALDFSASVLRSALVNIICYVPERTNLHSISGSGIFIDPKGIILTNAHIAQYFLLADRDVSCTIRSGSPAVNNYAAALIYISPIWLRENANVLTQATPSGTGQYDFALLAVTKSATSSVLPLVFPSIPLAQKPPLPGTPVIIASYGAQFLGSSQIQSSLFPTIVFGSVKNVFTFATNTIDVIALGGSAAAQEGSSGGGVSNAFGELVGTITTSTIEGDTNTRFLSAITASYIRAEYASETGEALDILLNKPTSTSIADFVPQIPALLSILTAQFP